MEQIEESHLDLLSSYCRRLEEIVAKRNAEFALLNKMLTREYREHRMTEDGLSLRATILDNTEEAVFLINNRGGLTYANETAINLYGYYLEEFLQMQVYQLFETSPGSQDIELQHLEMARIKGYLELKTVHKRKDGSPLPVRLKYRSARTPHGNALVCVVSDISGEEKLRSVLQTVSGVIWTTDNKLQITSVMCTGSQEMGFEICPCVGKPISEFLEKNGIDKQVAEVFPRVLSGGSVTMPLEIQRFGKTFRGWVAPFYSNPGQIVGTFSYLKDMTMLTVKS